MKRTFLSVALVLVLLALSFFLGVQGGTAKPKVGSILPARPLELQMTENAERGIASAVAQLVSATPTPADFSAALESCLGIHLQESFQQYLESEIFPKALSRHIEIENFHLRTSSGQEFRMQKKDSEREVSNGTQKELTLFGVDSEGLPVPQAWPVQIKELTNQARWQWFQSLGQIYFHQSKEIVMLPGQKSLSLEYRNGEIYEFYWMTESKSFACRRQDCHCF